MTRAAWVLLLAGCATESGVLGARFSLPEARATKSELVLRCQPEDGEVMLDGVPQGGCGDFDGRQRALSLRPGARRVAVSKRGFLPWEAEVVADGTRMIVNVTLIPTEGSTP
jgi:hypothetical protein